MFTHAMAPAVTQEACVSKALLSCGLMATALPLCSSQTPRDLCQGLATSSSGPLLSLEIAPFKLDSAPRTQRYYSAKALGSPEALPECHPQPAPGGRLRMEGSFP